MIYMIEILLNCGFVEFEVFTDCKSAKSPKENQSRCCL